MNAKNRLFVLRVSTGLDAADLVSAALFDGGAGAIEEQEKPDGIELIAYGEDQAEVERLAMVARDASGGTAEVNVLEIESDWATAWTEHLEAVRLTGSVAVRPSHVKPGSAAEVGASTVIVVEPELVFGLGSHPTTRLAARAVEDAVRERPAARMLDVGSGTGILAMVAACAGAATAVGLDVDPVAVESARRNAAANGLGGVCSFLGGPLEGIQGPFDVVAANLDAETIRRLAPLLAERLAGSGVLLITGILAETAAETEAVFHAAGLSRVLRADDGGWALLGLGRAGNVPAKPYG